MSLRVWLPLNGDLHNQGISNHTIALTNGNTWTSPGKIGNNALTLTKLQLIVPSTSCMSGAKEISYAYWIKVNTAWSNDWLDGIRWIETDGSATSTARQEFYTNCTLIGTWYKGGAIYGKAFTPGVWTHLAGTFNYNTGEAKFYINGVLSGSTTNINTAYYCRGDFCIGDNGVDICENDVRIYDHCLSAAEVREIAQGLVLHYKLDDITNGIEDSSGYNHNGQIIGDLIIEPNGPRYTQNIKWNSSSPTDNSETGICYIQSPLSLTTPLQMTVAWWSKPDNGYNNTSNHGAFCTSNSTSRPTDYNSTAFHHRDSGFDICPSDGSGVKRLTFTYTKGSWHHHAVTYDGNIAKAYQDGVKTSEITVGTNKTLASFSQLYIGYSQAGGVRHKTLGNYGDFRVYVTALSSDDILQLYRTSAKVDNKQKLHTFELVENQNKIAIDKQGRVLCKELTENTNTKFYKTDQVIDTEQIIEF